MIKAKTKRIHDEERGWAVVVAIVVMSLLVGLGLTTLSLVDNQQQQGRLQRVREGSFNLAEGMLYSTSESLARNWPASAASAFPDSCTESNYSGAVNTKLCTNPADISSSTGGANPIFTGADFTGASNVRWAVQVRDNGNSAGDVLTNYDKNTADGVTAAGAADPQKYCSVSTRPCPVANLTTCPINPCTYDFNKDQQVFVRAEGTVRGKTRRLVALLRLELRTIGFNSNVVQASWIESTNNGQDKVFVDAQPPGVTSPSTIVLSCNPAAVTPNTNCPDPEMTSSGKNQIDPPDKYATNQTVLPGMSDADYSGLVDLADHIYNDSTGCPDKNTPSLWTGLSIFDFSTNSTICPIASNSQINSPTSPGALIFNRGGVSFTGTADYYGLIYARNSPVSTSSALVDLGGGGVVHGQVTVDGAAGILVGGKEGSITYDPNSLPPLKTTGTAGLVQSTWRELTPTQ